MALNKKDADTKLPKRSLREDAEDQFARTPKPSPDLKEQMPEHLIHELRVHQIELETQAEELKRIQQELEISRFKYLDLYDFAPVGYLTLNDKAVVTEANLTAAKLLKVERRFLLRARFSKYIFPEDQDQWYTYLAELKVRDTTQICTLTLVREDGSAFPARLESVRYTTPDEGSIAIRVTISDISDIKKAQDELSYKEEKYRNLFTYMIDGIALHELVYDASGNPADYRILDVNPAFEGITGLKREEALGKTSREVFRVATPPFIDRYARVATTGKAEKFAEYFDPMKKHFAISVYSPKKGRFATIFEDITERKKAEEVKERLLHELAQKNTELDRFTYTVSHDLKSPLLTLRGFIGLLEKDILKNDAAQASVDVARLSSAADTMERLITTLLALSRSGRSVDLPVSIPFTALAKEAAGLLDAALQGRGVTVVISDSMPVVSGDRQRLLQVMINLLDNAVKFMGDQKEPKVEVGVRTDTETLVFFVKDNGMGIKNENLPKIFGLFERFNPDVPGTGIGLATVKRIIEVHGGKCWVESEGVGKGATVCFTLPGVTERSPDPTPS